jgi:hypothetical protein
MFIVLFPSVVVKQNKIGTGILFDALKNNASVVELDSSETELTPAAYNSLCECLQANRTLAKIGSYSLYFCFFISF